MIHCHNCGTDNLDGSEFCDECGTKLAAAAPPRTPNYMPPHPAPPPPSFTRDTVTPKPATPYTPPPPPVRQSAPAASAGEAGNQANSQTVAWQPSGAVRRGGNPAEAQAKLVIQRGGKVGKEFPLAGNEALIGRWDADGGIFPDVDLDQDDPEAKISRRHARILLQNNQYLIEDLGSTNGTFINRGQRLLPGNKHPLNNGDEIIVGKTFLKFVLN
jgi:hypothetical protein